MAKKAKKQLHQMPPLSLLDKGIYWTILLLLCTASLLLAFGSMYLRDRIAFADQSVIAVETNVSFMWLTLPCTTFFLITFFLWYQLYQSRKPIFGRRNFKYGPPAWPRVYPVFMKNKPYVFVSKENRKERRRVCVILLIVLLVSFIPLPWSLYGRDCLRNDGSIVQYNMFNLQTHTFASEQLSEIKIETYGYRIWYRGVQMVFITESGKEYRFNNREFRDDANPETFRWLEAMVNVKNCFDPEIISYDGMEDLEKVIVGKEFSEKETELLYQLFGHEYTKKIAQIS